jgi:hypothetical protein
LPGVSARRLPGMPASWTPRGAKSSLAGADKALEEKRFKVVITCVGLRASVAQSPVGPTPPASGT